MSRWRVGTAAWGYTLVECTDTFTGSAVALAGQTTTTGGLIWQQLTGGALGTGAWSKTGSGLAIPTTSAGPAGDATAVVNCGSPDCWVQTQLLSGIASPAYGGVIFRLTDDNNYWLFYTNGGNLFLDKFVAGVGTQVWTASTLAAYGDVLTVRMSDDTIEGYLNGALQVTWTDGFNDEATRHGIWATTYALGAVKPQVTQDNFNISKARPALPSVPGAVLQQQKYVLNGTNAVTQAITLSSAVAAGQTAVVLIYEFPSSRTVTAVSGLGATWTQATRQNNSSGNIAMSVWVGSGCTGGSTVTTTSSGIGQTNEVNLSIWSGLAGTISGTNGANALVTTSLTTGLRTPSAAGNLIIGGVVTNTTPTVTWSDSPAAWTALTGSTDMFPAYRVATSLASHSRSGAASVAANYAGTIVEIA